MKKFLIVTFIFCTVIITTPIQIFASSNAINSRELTPKANSTGYKYKTINGKLYKRLWSYTYNRWEKPNWTLVG